MVVYDILDAFVPLGHYRQGFPAPFIESEAGSLSIEREPVENQVRGWSGSFQVKARRQVTGKKQLLPSRVTQETGWIGKGQIQMITI